jgi:hypothetical protein
MVRKDKEEVAPAAPDVKFFWVRCFSLSPLCLRWRFWQVKCGPTYKKLFNTTCRCNVLLDAVRHDLVPAVTLAISSRQHPSVFLPPSPPTSRLHQVGEEQRGVVEEQDSVARAEEEQAMQAAAAAAEAAAAAAEAAGETEASAEPPSESISPRPGTGRKKRRSRYASRPSPVHHATQ